MEKKSKVTSVTQNGTWNSQYGTLFKHEIEFANGDIGEYNSKSKDQTNFIVGQETDYDITSREHQGNTYYTIKTIKPANSQPFTGGAKNDPETSKKIARMSVLKCATDLVIAKEIRFDEILVWAKTFESYVEGTTTVLPTNPQQSNDLPF